MHNLFIIQLCVQPIKLLPYHVSEQQRLTVFNQLFFKPILDSPVGQSFKLFINLKLDNSPFQFNVQCKGVGHEIQHFQYQKHNWIIQKVYLLKMLAPSPTLSQMDL